MESLIKIVFAAVVVTAGILFSHTGKKPTPLALVKKYQTYQEIIQEVSLQHRVPPELSLAVALQESNIDQTKRGKAGEIGIFQLMPSTAKDMGEDPTTADGNIRAGVKYLKTCWQMHGKDMLRCYNGGIGWNKVKDPDRKKIIEKNTYAYQRDVLARIMKN